jgi:hypothetical protein
MNTKNNNNLNIFLLDLISSWNEAKEDRLLHISIQVHYKMVQLKKIVAQKKDPLEMSAALVRAWNTQTPLNSVIAPSEIFELVSELEEMVKTVIPFSLNKMDFSKK